MTPRRVLLLGARGQVGSELSRKFAGPGLLALGRSEADFSRPESLRAVVRSARPRIILNAAAYTAVDRAESEPELADRINRQAPRVLAEEAERLGALLVHYSTDYVFDGSKADPWVETDPTGPLNVYGRTKLAGEQAIAAVCPRHLILRTSWVYAATGNNFLRTMLRLGRERDTLRVVNDQWGAPTSATALAEATRAILDHLHQDPSDAHELNYGLYHATSKGRASWCEFAQAIFAEAARHDPRSWPRVEGIDSADYPTPARRPRNSVLSSQKLWEHFKISMPAWERELSSVVSAHFFSAELDLQRR